MLRVTKISYQMAWSKEGKAMLTFTNNDETWSSWKENGIPDTGNLTASGSEWRQPSCLLLLNILMGWKQMLLVDGTGRLTTTSGGGATCHVHVSRLQLGPVHTTYPDIFQSTTFSLQLRPSSTYIPQMRWWIRNLSNTLPRTDFFRIRFEYGFVWTVESRCFRIRWRSDIGASLFRVKYGAKNTAGWLRLFVVSMLCWRRHRNVGFIRIHVDGLIWFEHDT